MPGWGGQRDERDHRGDHDWDRRPLASTGDGRGGAPRPWGGRQFETRYDSQGLQYQSRSETMAAQAVHNSGARRVEPQRRYDEPLRRRDEPQRRHDEPSHLSDEPRRRHDVSWEWRHRDEPQRRYDEPSRHHSETAYYDGRRETLHISGSRTQKRRLPEPTASTAPTWRAGTPSSQEPGRAPPAPKGAVDGRALSGQISKAGNTHELLRLSADHSASLNHIHVANLWNKLGKQRDASGSNHREEMRRLLRRTVELVDSCEARELSNIAHGLAKCTLVGLDGETGALFAEVAEAAVRGGLSSFKPQALANTAWAFATADYAAPALLDAIAAAAVPRLRDFNPQNLANTAWAFATAGHAAPALLDAIAGAAVPRLRDFNPQDLANTAWAFATADQRAPALLDAIAAAAVPRLREFNPQDLANTAWSFAAADHLAPALFDSHVFVQLCAEHSLTLEALCQLHQWQLWREERGATWPSLPPELAQRCRDAFSSEDGVPSKLQRDVVASLLALELDPREEVRSPQGYSLDAVVLLHGGREVAIEVDGPSHFCGRTPTSATALKRRQLRAAGWALLPVPYWEWDTLGSSEAAKQEYLRAALQGAPSALAA
jgi:hypothetical protein